MKYLHGMKNLPNQAPIRLPYISPYIFCKCWDTKTCHVSQTERTISPLSELKGALSHPDAIALVLFWLFFLTQLVNSCHSSNVSLGVNPFLPLGKVASSFEHTFIVKWITCVICCFHICELLWICGFLNWHDN